MQIMLQIISTGGGQSDLELHLDRARGLQN